MLATYRAFGSWNTSFDSLSSTRHIWNRDKCVLSLTDRYFRMVRHHNVYSFPVLQVQARELFSVLARGTAGWLSWEAGWHCHGRFDTTALCVVRSLRSACKERGRAMSRSVVSRFLGSKMRSQSFAIGCGNLLYWSFGECFCHCSSYGC